MKKSLLVLGMLALVLTACSAPADNKAAAASADPAATAAPVVDKPDADLSYAFGVSVGTSLQQAGVFVDYNAFLEGVKDTHDKKSPKITMEEANQKIRSALMALQELKAKKGAEESEKFLADNKAKEGVKVTDSGLQYKVNSEGTGAKPAADSTVKVHYTGKLIDGTVFDSSVERGEPAQFSLAGVIPGWTEGLQLMTVGSKYTLFLPASLAYGDNGTPDGSIGPNQALIFDVELLDIVSGQ